MLHSFCCGLVVFVCFGLVWVATENIRLCISPFSCKLRTVDLQNVDDRLSLERAGYWLTKGYSGDLEKASGTEAVQAIQTRVAGPFPKARSAFQSCVLEVETNLMKGETVETGSHALTTLADSMHTHPGSSHLQHLAAKKSWTSLTGSIYLAVSINVIQQFHSCIQSSIKGNGEALRAMYVYKSSPEKGLSTSQTDWKQSSNVLSDTDISSDSFWHSFWPIFLHPSWHLTDISFVLSDIF